MAKLYASPDQVKELLIYLKNTNSILQWGDSKVSYETIAGTIKYEPTRVCFRDGNWAFYESLLTSEVWKINNKPIYINTWLNLNNPKPQTEEDYYAWLANRE